MDKPKNFTVFLKNGEQIKINDHVYCSPSWTIRDGTPYSIARVMEFLRPEGKFGPESEAYHYTRVRLAWYYRPSDVSDRPVTDSRLLLAAIFSEICDINQIRAKCYVLHRDKISDLSGWKKRPDRFYFNKLFDPYIKKEFEVIQSTDVRNLPDDIRNDLMSKYEYIVAEKEVIPELTDSIRLCKSCDKWCPGNDSVQCDRCKHFYHMTDCVQPPLAAKPSRGYGWTCAPCSRDHEEAVQANDIRQTEAPSAGKPKSNAPAPRGRGRPRKDRTQAEKEENQPIKHFRMWPFRYFGQFTLATDTLDDDDLIFPRAPVRVGPKYQANIPELNSTSTAEEERATDDDDTIDVLSIVRCFIPSEVTEMDNMMQNFQVSQELKTSVDWLTEVVRRFSDAALCGEPFSTVNMKYPMREEKWKSSETRYTDREWTLDEKQAFEIAIDAHAGELRGVRNEIVTRDIYEVVRYYGHWKNMKLGEENRRLRKNGPPPEPDYVKYVGNAQRQTVGLPDDERSVITAPSKPPSCAACRTRESKVWWKAPKGLPTNLLCDACGASWRRYADLNVRPLREESIPSLNKNNNHPNNNGGSARLSEKRDGDPLTGPSAKRARVNGTGTTHPTPPPPIFNSSNVPWLRCQACMKNAPLGQVVKCKNCAFTVHAASCGAIVKPNDIENWLCDICRNEELQEASVSPECLLCPRVRPRPTGQRITGPLPDSFLRACKPTEGQGWTHVLCAVFLPELCFTDASRMRMVEGISSINPHRWSARCVICHSTEGAVVRCSDCTREFHISCAWNHGLRFGFEIQPVKSTRRDQTITVTFKGESGCMGPVVACKDHDHKRRGLYDICERDHEGGETALQLYCRLYKQASVASAHALLRKARRMDQILNIRNDASVNGTVLPYTESITTIPSLASAIAIAKDDDRCSKCTTQYTPAFYNPTNSSTDRICHRCYYETELFPPSIVDEELTTGTTTPPPPAINGISNKDASPIPMNGIEVA